MTEAAAREMATGIAACEARRFDEAAAHFRAALAAGGEPVRAWTNLGVALRASGRPEAAIACHSRALAFDPLSVESLGGRGGARFASGDLKGALDDLTKAIAIDPDEALYRRNLGFALMAAGRPGAALEAFDAGLRLSPGDAHLEFHRAGALLQLGRFGEAWPGYDRRFEIGGIESRHEGAPIWDGAPLKGRRLLLFAEQGHGDMIQFARFLPAALARAAGEVAMEVHPSLVRLFAMSFPGARVFAVGEPAPEHDVRLPFTSIARIADGRPETGLNADGAFLYAPDAAPGSAARHDFRLGLAWKGRPAPWDRSCPLKLLLTLAEVPGVTLVSLQRGGAAEIAEAGAEALIEDAAAGLSDFADDARVLASLDLVISIDTAVCHFVGALGRPVWTLLTSWTDWRYPVEGDRTPWYPSMRLFRQPSPGDWKTPIGETRRALAALASERAQ